MNNITQPGQPISRASPAYYHLVHTLTRGLPPPLNDTPEALYARNQAAIEKVAALLPVNANEAGLAATCVAARAQAEDVMRLLRVHAGDIGVVMKLNAQYVSMVRTSLSAHGHLLRTQALRHKREANNTARDAGEWAQHVAAGSMQQVLDAGPLPAIPAAADAAPAPAAEEPPAQAAAPLAPKLAPVLIEAPSPSPRVETTAPRRPRSPAPPAEADVQPRDLVAEAEHYVILHPHRAWQIRRHGGLPLGCDYGPPDDDLVHAIVTGTTPLLRVLDDPNAEAGFDWPSDLELRAN